MNLDHANHDSVIAVDFDGTLAAYDGWKGPTTLGQPVPAMLARVKQWLQSGQKVVILTARVWPLGTSEECRSETRQPDEDPYEYLRKRAKNGEQEDRCASARAGQQAIEQWCQQHLGEVLPVSCVKTPMMIQLWDDRAVAVEVNTGKPLNQPQLT